MRIPFFFGFLLLACSCFGSSQAIMENEIKHFLEEFRSRMCHALPKFGLPALDPLQFTHVEYEMNNKYFVDFKCSSTDFRLTGLSDFVVNDLKITTNILKRSSINVTMPLTAFTSSYTAKGSLAYILNLNGDGSAEAALKDFNIAISWKIGTSLHASIKGLKIEILIGGIHVNFENLFEEERINSFFHALINELGIELLNDVWEEESQFVETYIENLVNKFLRPYTYKEIIKIIGGMGGNGPIFGENDPPGDCKEDVIKI